MSLPYWSDEQVFEQMYAGSMWDGQTITYTFPEYAHQIQFERGEGASFVPLSPQQQAMARLALGTWNDLIAMEIIPGQIGDSDLEFGNTNMIENQSYAHAYFPQLGSIWFTSLHLDLAVPVLGTHGFTTYIHEIGHAIGLNHMGDYNGDDDDGPSSYQDSTVLSVMSYYGPELDRGNGLVAWGDWSLRSNGDSYGAQTPMLNDIMVIQAMYGTATTRSEDTVYGFGSTVQGDTAILYDFSLNTHPILTLYDSGGIDTLNLGGWSSDSRVDLRPGQYSDVNNMTNNLAIARDVIIENVITGTGNDKIFSNSANNFIDGGEGFDRVFFSGDFANYELAFDLPAGVYTVHDKTGADGTDTLRNMEFAGFSNFGGSLNKLTPGVHRLYNGETGTHLLTSDNDEAREALLHGGFRYESLAFGRNVTPDDNSISVYRFFNADTGAHFLSADASEVAGLLQSGFMTYEGLAFRAYKNPVEDTLAVHRFHNVDTGRHFYTADAAEAEHVKIGMAGNFSYEGIAFYGEALHP